MRCGRRCGRLGVRIHPRHVEQEFWRRIAEGMGSEDAAAAVGVSGPVGSRWFRHGGGMPPITLAAPSGRYLSFVEREEVAILRAQDQGVREIARRVGRHPSTISRELRRNAATRSGKVEYHASVAQWKARSAAKRAKTARLVENPRLRDYVQDKLAGVLRGPDGVEIIGPDVAPWKGRNKPHRQDRRWALAWSPQQIANRLPIDFPDDESMRISHEAIYQELYIEGRGALKRELVACLRTGRALRVPRARSRNTPGAHVTADVVISQRPAEAADRAVPGHWEGDLIIGLNRSAIGTLVERTTRYTMLVHLPRAEGYGIVAPTKNGPPLGGYGAVAMKDALATTMTTLPEQLRRTLTWDRGKELSQHAQFKSETGIAVYFADPHSPWQRATNENHTACGASTSPRAPTCPGGSARDAGRRNSPQQPTPQNPGREDAGRSPQRAPTVAFPRRCCFHRLNLVRAIRYTERLAEAEAVASVGSRGDSYDTRWQRRSTRCSRPSASATRSCGRRAAGRRRRRRDRGRRIRRLVQPQAPARRARTCPARRVRRQPLGQHHPRSTTLKNSSRPGLDPSNRASTKPGAIHSHSREQSGDDVGGA